MCASPGEECGLMSRRCSRALLLETTDSSAPTVRLP